MELAPFRQGIAAGAGAVMVAHVEMPALDPTPGPATFSRPIVTGLLRQELGFSGLIYTDSMLMDAISAMTGPGEAAVKAVQAGVDVVLDPEDVREAAAAHEGRARERHAHARATARSRRAASWSTRRGSACTRRAPSTSTP